MLDLDACAVDGEADLAAERVEGYVANFFA